MNEDAVLTSPELDPNIYVEIKRDVATRHTVVHILIDEPGYPYGRELMRLKVPHGTVYTSAHSKVRECVMISPGIKRLLRIYSKAKKVGLNLSSLEAAVDRIAASKPHCASEFDEPSRPKEHPDD